MWKVLRVIIALALGGATVGSLMITAQISRLAGGMRENVTAAQALVTAQTAIRDRGAALEQIVASTRRVGTGLDSLIGQAQSLEQGALAVAQANQKTLELNQSMLKQTTATEADLRRVSDSLQTMIGSTGAIRSYMASLRDTVAGDVDILSNIGVNASRMNLRTPGW